MRVSITAQADSRGELVDLLKRIVADVHKPQMLGAKERGGNYGFTWEIVPDENEG